MEPSLNQDDVKNILLRYSQSGLTHCQEFYNCIVQADADFIDQYGNDPTLKPRAKAEIRNSKILHYAKQLIFKDPVSYECHEDANSFYIRVATLVIVRFRKLDKYGHSSNGKTNRDSNYRQQKSDSLPFMKTMRRATNLDVGYTLNETGQISEISFSCCAVGGVHWRIQAKDLNVVENQIPLFAVREEDILPVLHLDIKEHLKKTNNERQAGGTI